MQSIGQVTPEQQRIVPHARTLRKAREQIKQMVASGVSLRCIRSYLLAWSSWWVQTAKCWTQNELLTWFITACWDEVVTTIAVSLLNRYINPVQETDLQQTRQHSAFYQQ
jgi:hypothetical protein